MSLDPKAHLAELLRTALASVAPGASADIHLERPRDAGHGDFASNLAMQLARALKENPRKIAERLVHELPVSPWVQRAEVAGAGFINFTLAAAAKTRVVHGVLARGGDFGKAEIGPGPRRKVQVEFVSANPTGPLHVGHGRGAAYGASLASLLAFAGFDVCREYYVNDAGRQMDILGVSTWLRYLELHDQWVPFPPNAYQGDYVREMAQQIREAHGDRYVHPAEAILACAAPAPARREDGAYTADEKEQLETHLDGLIAAAKDLLGEEWAYVHQHALTEQLADCREDLEEFGVHFDCWFSERSLYDTGMVARAVAELEKRGHIYVQNGAKWFRSTEFGDEKDRVVQRENGLYTYFASDIAYHANKFERGFDACRFFYLLRKQDQALDFDLTLAKSESNDNPVYYVQYAHARICSVFNQWGGREAELADADLAPLASERELGLCARLQSFPALIEQAAADYAPHALAFYLRDLAGDFHSWYNAERLLVDDEAVRRARLALALAVRQVLRNGLQILGVSAPEAM